MRASRLARAVATSIALLAVVAASAHAQTATPEEGPPVPESPAIPSSLNIPFAGISTKLTAIREDLDAATARALQLETEISALEADNRALTERLAVTAERIVERSAALRAAEEHLAAAEAKYARRLVDVYKSGGFDPITLLLTSDSLSELVSRAAVLTRIAEGDSAVVADLAIAASDARYQHAALEELRVQDRALKAEQDSRLGSLATMLAEQELLVATLTAESREALLVARRFTAETRQQWRLSSIPIGTNIPRATASVDSHPGDVYLISAYMPRHYRSSGQTFSAVSSWYGPGFNGRSTASGQIFNEDDFTCASRTLPFGTVLALTRGERRVIVYVNDRGPYIAGRDLDLSKAAATALGFSGVASVRVEIVAPVQ